jgi:epoxyqueuosine reductase
MPISTSELLPQLKARAHAEGLAGPSITSASLPAVTGQRLDQFLGSGHHGEMAWMDERKDQRKSPDALWPEARTALVFAQSYAPALDPLTRLQHKSTGVISVYAQNRDYHDVFKAKLRRLAQWFHQSTDEAVKVFVDTAPLMEKPLAEQAGLGWQGKHTNLVSRTLGSWFFIGTMLTTATLKTDAAEADHCGTCTACLDICPTRAFPAPRQLDARRCISYLTIEHKGHIPSEFRGAIGNRIYGCDDCLAVCPWNKFAEMGHDAKLQARADLLSPPLAELLTLDDAKFRKLFTGSPVKRTGRNRFIRNCLIAAGNSGDATLVPAVEGLLTDPSPLVRAMAVWALAHLLDGAALRNLHLHHTPQEQDADVASEWRAATA